MNIKFEIEQLLDKYKTHVRILESLIERYQNTNVIPNYSSEIKFYKIAISHLEKILNKIKPNSVFVEMSADDDNMETIYSKDELNKF
jgi:hypothetical protein